MAIEVDPWDWDVDQVVSAFCHSRTLWQQGRQNSALPDPVALEQVLRENDVDGATLLSHIDLKLLKDDFGIKSLGQRSNICWAIDKLRGRSIKYMVERPDPHPGYANPHSRAGSIFPDGFSGLQTPRASCVTEQSTVYATPEHPTTRPGHEQHDGSTEGGASPVFARPLLPERAAPGHGVMLAPPVLIQDALPESPAHSPGATTGKRRASEVVVEDQTGRKKRRLDLTAAVSATTPTKFSTFSGETLIASNSGTSAAFSTANLSTSAGAAATATTRKDIELRSRLCGLQSRDPSFLGKSRLSLEETFFGYTGYGKPLNADFTMSPLTEDGPLPGKAFSPDEPFFYDGSTARSVHGRQSFINKKMMHFLSKDPGLEVDTSNESLAFFPYSASSTRLPESRAVIHIQNNGDTTTATREKLSRLEDGDNGLEADSTSSNHEWDFLAHWQDESSKELPVYLESDDEEDSAELDGLEEEIHEDAEEDAEEDARMKKRLSQEEAAEIIEEFVAEHIRRWKEKSLPVFKEKALSIWRRGRTSKGRLLAATFARQDIAEFENRLNHYKQNIMCDAWSDKKPLVKQCEILERTIEQIEEKRFEMSVWRHSTAPPPPTGKLCTRKKRTAHASYNPEEHNLDSEDEIVDDRMALHNFIDVDDLVPLDLTSIQGSEDSHDQQVPDADPVEEMDADGEQEQKTPAHDSDSDSLLGGRQKNLDDNTSEKSTSNKIKEEPMLHPLTPGSTRPKVFSQVIDLTVDSDAEDRVLKPVARSSQATSQRLRGRSNKPENDSDADVLSWGWYDLEEEGDCRRIIIKLIRTMPPTAYRDLRDHVIADDSVRKLTKIHELMENVRQVLRKRLRYNPDFSFAMHAYSQLQKLLQLYVCWNEKSPEFFRQGYDTQQENFKLVHLEEETLNSALSTIADNEGADLSRCLGTVYVTFERHAHPLSADVEDGDIGGPSQSTPIKRRKRRVAESQSAVNLRDNVKKSAAVWEDRTKLFLSQYRNQSASLGPADDGIVINTGKEDDEREIFIDPHIAQSLKPHQIEGIRFVWREIVGTSSDDSEETQGALLAHTMGLGKTLQVIAFLATLAQAAISRDEGIRKQIPMKLRKLRILILSPAGLISNWCDEFKRWTQGRSAIGTPWEITAQTAAERRVPLLDEWYAESGGGVLLMGYELFREWILNPKREKRRPLFGEEGHKEICKKLLEGPSLIIADEAHKLKNNNSAINQAAKKLQSKSRIALTGSPLSNNLNEYFAMVDWIAPGYLGEPVEFKANYVEPIEEGLYVTSTAYERRKARVRLQALTEILEPKIHRKEIDALKGQLKPKVEFVLKVPLTSLQLDVYKAFVKLASHGMDDTVSNARLWGYMTYLQMLCSHPALFVARVETGKNKKKEKDKKKGKKRAVSPVKRIQQLQDETDKSPNAVEGDQTSNDTDHSEDTRDEVEDEDGDPSDSIALQIADGLLAEFADRFQPILAAYHEAQFSHKVNLLLQIVQNSRAAKDKLLIFSHRIPTLDYLGVVLEKAGVKFARLDGSTPMGKRQEMTKNFNKGDGCDVFLISTRAGGAGFNLYGANRVVLFDFSFNPSWEEQAIGRAYRLGQEKPVFVYRFISAGTLEEALFNQTVYKLQLAYQVVERKNTKAKAHRLRTFIKAPDDSELKDLSKYTGTDKVLDVIIGGMDAGNELVHDIAMAETLREENEEQLDDQDRAEMQQLIREGKLRNTDPEAFRRAQAARNGLPAATARPDSATSILNRPTPSALPPPATAPVAHMVAPARALPSPAIIPPKARFALPTGPNDQPHGLPDPPRTPRSNIPGPSNVSPRSLGLPEGPPNGSSSPHQQK